ncbi:PepSY domain-containing protein [Streptosporangium sp. NPDC051022]|uniref:PepSY domain-containing protein n=1 Tax=Streptosporangium sp. NPDC051022 TaxID=3155752 RepID=UPI0034159617
MRKPMIIAGIATAAVLVAGGGAAMAAADAEPTPAATTSSPSDDHGTATAPKISSSQAEKTALDQVPAGWVTSAELETEHGRQTWEIEVRSDNGGEHEFTVDAETGSLITGKADKDDDGDSATGSGGGGGDHGDGSGDHDTEDDD